MVKNNPYRRSRLKAMAFTLIEMLCVVAVVGILIAMLFPAVQAAREASRSVACKASMRQLGIGLVSHESRFRRLPPGTLGAKSDWRVSLSDRANFEANPNSVYYLHNFQNTSWIAHVLPDLEMVSTYNRLPGVSVSTSQTYLEYLSTAGAGVPRHLVDDAEVLTASKLNIQLLFCPSDHMRDEQQVKSLCGSQPAFINDYQLDGFLYYSVDRDMAGTNYAACSGASSGGFQIDPEVQRFEGVFRSRSTTKLAEIQDGLSNTICIGETLGEISGGVRTSKNVWVFATMCRGRSDMLWMTTHSPRSPGLELIGDQWYNHQAGFGSKHSSGANFTFVDGSVQHISRSVELRTFYRLCGRSDAEVAMDSP